MALSTAVDLSAVARVVGIKTAFKDLRGGGALFLPQRIAVVGQGSTSSTYSTTKAQFTSATAAANVYGFGSPIHLALQQLFPTNGDGVGTIPVTVYPLVDDASGVAATSTLTPSGPASGTGSFRVSINNMLSEAFLIEANETIESQCTKIADAINANINLPMTAAATLTEVTLTSKWKGESANDLVVSLVELSENDTGVTYAIVQPSGGAVNPGVQTALNQVGNVWESLFLNCLNIEDTTALDLYSNFGEGRWGSLVRKPCVAFSGNTKTTVSAATTISDARKNDRTNAQLVAPGSDDLPLVVAARQLARIAKIANNNPPQDYGSQQATGLIPGADGDQWTYADRDQAVKKGSSTVEVRDGVVTLADTVTFYHPTGDPLPAYRYVVDIIKLQNIIFNIDLIFNNPEWDGAPLLPDDQPTVNRTAKKPKTAVAAVCALLDSLALNAILSNPEAAKASTLAAINDQNPKRLDVTTTVQLSGNTNIISVDLNFGFYFGVTPVVA